VRPRPRAAVQTLVYPDDALEGEKRAGLGTLLEVLVTDLRQALG